MKIRSFCILVFVLVLIISTVGCSPQQTAIPATETPTPEPATVTPSPTADAKATANAQASATAQAKTATELSRRKTLDATHAIATAAKSTEQANLLVKELDKLVQDKAITTTKGEFKSLKNFSADWAQINWYQWWETGVAPKNFVVQADVEYEVASKYSDWDSTGCGFVFRENGQEKSHHHYRVIYSPNGWLYLDGVDGFEYGYAKWIINARKKINQPQIPSGKFKILLAAEEDWITVYIDGKQAMRKQDKTFLIPGNLAYTLGSGINTGFGTRCKMTNVGIYVLD